MTFSFLLWRLKKKKDPKLMWRQIRNLVLSSRWWARFSLASPCSEAADHAVLASWKCLGSNSFPCASPKPPFSTLVDKKIGLQHAMLCSPFHFCTSFSAPPHPKLTQAAETSTLPLKIHEILEQRIESLNSSPSSLSC